MGLSQVLIGLGILPLPCSSLTLLAGVRDRAAHPGASGTPWMLPALLGCTMLGIWTRKVILGVEWSQSALALPARSGGYAEYVG